MILKPAQIWHAKICANQRKTTQIHKTDRIEEEAVAGKKASITEIAGRFGISPSTVSRAINGQPGVGEEMRRRIQAYAREIGYRREGRGAPAAMPENMVAIIVGDIRNPFYADLVFAVQKELNRCGYMLSVFNSEYDEQEELRYMRLAQQFRFAGIIQVTVTTENVRAMLAQLDMPVVMVNRMLSSFETDVVLLDNYEAGYVATRHLVEQGHSRIGFLVGQKNSSSSMQRYEGFRQVMKNYHLPVREEDVLQGDLTMDTAYRVTKEAFSGGGERMTAMVVSNDLAAFGVMAYCEEAGIRIPEDLSIVSFDNTLLSGTGLMRLTTVDAHVGDMGRIAAELMVRRIAEPESEHRRVVLDPVLMVRGTTRRPG